MSGTLTQYAGELAGRNNYRNAIAKVAAETLSAALGEEEGKKKAVGFTLAFQAAAQANPDILNLSPQTVGRALAMCILTDLRPGGHHPEVWLLPKGGELQCWIAPHGYRKLARRAGAVLTEIPVRRGCEDDIEARISDVASGGVFIPRPSEHVGTPEDLAGFYVVIRDQHETRVEWLPSDEIAKRREAASTKKVWDKWPMEMARKTAIKWAFNRGFVSMEPAIREAVSMETAQEVRQLPPPRTVVERAALMGPPTIDAEPDLVEPDPPPAADEPAAAAAPDDVELHAARERLKKMVYESPAAAAAEGLHNLRGVGRMNMDTVEDWTEKIGERAAKMADGE